MADQLPPLPFDFDGLRARMSQFTTKFDSYIASGRSRVLASRNTFRVSIAELAEDRKSTRRQIEILQSKASQHAQTLAKEEQEKQEMESAIGGLSSDRAKLESQKKELEKRIAEASKAIEEKEAAQRAFQAKISKQQLHSLPELGFWETSLGLRIEGAGQSDRLKFVFSALDERDWEREAWFELCTERRDYEVGGCSPKLERERVERVLERLNETRELAVLLQGMRELFVEAMRN
jgi:kinetochore protein Spc25